MGDADEGHRADGMDDRPPLRDRVRKARSQQAPHKIDHGPLRAPEAQWRAVESLLALFHQFPLLPPGEGLGWE